MATLQQGLSECALAAEASIAALPAITVESLDEADDIVHHPLVRSGSGSIGHSR
jgi:hypothetical protein